MIMMTVMKIYCNGHMHKIAHNIQTRIIHLHSFSFRVSDSMTPCDVIKYLRTPNYEILQTHNKGQCQEKKVEMDFNYLTATDNSNQKYKIKNIAFIGQVSTSTLQVLAAKMYDPIQLLQITIDNSIHNNKQKCCALYLII